jgi:hypothetical protein
MRRVATALETGPSSLYAHVVNKEDLDELLISRLCAEISLPEPDAATWRQQAISVCTQLRDQYLRYPGISRGPSLSLRPIWTRCASARECSPSCSPGASIRRPRPGRPTRCFSTSTRTASRSPRWTDSSPTIRAAGSSAVRTYCADSRFARHLPVDQALRRRAHRRNRPRPLRLHRRPDDRRSRTPLGKRRTDCYDRRRNW